MSAKTRGCLNVIEVGRIMRKVCYIISRTLGNDSEEGSHCSCVPLFFFKRAWAGEKQRERETENPKQDTMLPLQSLTWSSNSGTMGSWPELKPGGVSHLPDLATQELHTTAISGRQWSGCVRKSLPAGGRLCSNDRNTWEHHNFEDLPVR